MQIETHCSSTQQFSKAFKERVSTGHKINWFSVGAVSWELMLTDAQFFGEIKGDSFWVFRHRRARFPAIQRVFRGRLAEADGRLIVSGHFSFPIIERMGILALFLAVFFYVLTRLQIIPSLIVSLCFCLTVVFVNNAVCRKCERDVISFLESL